MNLLCNVLTLTWTGFQYPHGFFTCSCRFCNRYKHKVRSLAHIADTQVSVVILDHTKLNPNFYMWTGPVDKADTHPANTEVLVWGIAHTLKIVAQNCISLDFHGYPQLGISAFWYISPVRTKQLSTYFSWVHQSSLPPDPVYTLLAHTDLFTKRGSIHIILE